MTQSDILLKHLSTVFDPELGANIVELGMVKKVDHEGFTVKIDLALTIADCPMRSQIENEITRKLTLLENVETVEINVVAMDQKDRTAVMEKARTSPVTHGLPSFGARMNTPLLPSVGILYSSRRSKFENSFLVAIHWEPFFPVQERMPSLATQLVVGPSIPCQPERSLPLKSGVNPFSAAPSWTTQRVVAIRSAFTPGL